MPLKNLPRNIIKTKRKDKSVIAKKPNTVFLLTVGIGLSLVFFGIWGLYNWWKTTHITQPVSTQSNSEQPAETPLPTTDPPPFNYAADDPMIISLQTINTEGYIQKVSIDQKDNSIGVPSNINLAGWYTGSVKPGDVGLSIIDGHVQGRYSEGIFKRIQELRYGDTIRIEFGDHSMRQFIVKTSSTVPVGKAAPELFEQPDPTKRILKLITCGGSYDENTQSYDQRVIVSAELDKN
jgi:sortase A